SYKLLASARVKDLKYPGGLVALTVSPLRKSHTVAFADWMACVQGEEEGHRRIFAVFYRDRKIADFRHAVVIDGCDAEPYERLDGLSRHAIRLDVTVLVYAIARLRSRAGGLTRQV